MPFFQFQLKSVTQSAGRQEALQNARFAQSTIDRDVRMAGVNVVQFQPMLVQAGAMAITFNADLTTTDSADPGAVYYDPSVDPMEATSMDLSQAIDAAVQFVPLSDRAVLEQHELPSRAETSPTG